TLRDKGYSPEEIIHKASSIWTDKTKWKEKKKPHPFYRANSDGVEPSYLITPEQVLMLTSLTDRSKSNLMTSELRQVIDRISRSVANIKVTDRISDLYTRSLDVCKKSPKYQDALAQRNCDLILERTKSSLQIVHLKQETEEKSRIVQDEVATLIENIQRKRASGSYLPLIERTRINNSKMRMPWE
ncbi:MAG: hypothetical protein HON90_00785, partial [Halobacteriovoraceae bacterium]|nr:hypothetical protein [Halobacteriovoraceae bacterium]